MRKEVSSVWENRHIFFLLQGNFRMASTLLTGSNGDEKCRDIRWSFLLHILDKVSIVFVCIVIPKWRRESYRDGGGAAISLGWSPSFFKIQKKKKTSIVIFFFFSLLFSTHSHHVKNRVRNTYTTHTFFPASRNVDKRKRSDKNRFIIFFCFFFLRIFLMRKTQLGEKARFVQFSVGGDFREKPLDWWSCGQRTDFQQPKKRLSLFLAALCIYRIRWSPLFHFFRQMCWRVTEWKALKSNFR